MDIIKENKKYEMKPYEDEEESTNYLDIWRENPAYKDISGTISNVKLISLMVIIFFIIYSTFLLTSNLYISFGLSVFLVILFVVSFNNNIYSLEQAFTYLFRNFAETKPFDNFRFYMLKEDPATLLIINKNDMVTMATRIYRVEVLAENIKPTINQFLYALDESKIPYTYQVVQKHIIKLEENDTHHKKKFVPRHEDFYLKVFYVIAKFGLQLKAKQERLFENDDWNNFECRDELIKMIEGFLEKYIK